jgi:hypothetical protein
MVSPGMRLKHPWLHTAPCLGTIGAIEEIMKVSPAWSLTSGGIRYLIVYPLTTLVTVSSISVINEGIDWAIESRS